MNGLEIYARNIKNNGVFKTDTYAKIIAENYEGAGKIERTESIKINERWYQKWLIQFIALPIAVGLVIAFLVFYFGWNN